MILLGLHDYRRMPWANGRGTTVELFRVDAPDGQMLWRLSMASVIEDGPFSLFPGMERNLTVISGAGFRLSGPGIALDCRPLRPVAFPGDVPVRAEATEGQRSDDFNVISSRARPVPAVTVEQGDAVLPAGGTLCVFALGAAQVQERDLAKHDLLITDGPVTIRGNVPVIVVRVSV